MDCISKHLLNSLKNEEIKHAVILGATCSFSYLAVYTVRNILSAVSPAIMEEGVLTKTEIGSLSSSFFFAYAVGQLLNGLIGDKINAKYMICFGLFFAGVFHSVFPLFPSAYVCYALTGFFLSTIYAPMTKVVAENTKPLYATRCSLGFTFAAYIGSPLAGLLAVWMAWKGAFYVGSAALVIMSAAGFAAFSFMERRKIVQYGRFPKQKGKGEGLKVLFRRQIVRFTLVAILTGIVRTTVVFWMPTYFAEYLRFSSDTSALLFTLTTLGISAATFISVFVYEELHQNMELTLLLSFLAAALSFALVFLLKQLSLNILFLTVAIMGSNSAATMMWNVYCIRLKDTGMISSATGFLDFCGYMAAAASSALFAHIVSDIGWRGLIGVWFLLMVCGILVSLPFRFRSGRSASA